mmetsp:Transcript_22437/g.67517  ORF Transcript_22437/g.67517 Transcript_22437/m.67517 type:complete len:241 (+) Transcript_22437:728-1450(+)
MARGQRVIPTTILRHRLELVERRAHLELHVHAVVLRHCARQGKVLEVAADTHPHRQLRKAKCRKVELATFWQALDALKAPVVLVLCVLGHAVVVCEHLREKRLEPVVVGRLHGVATHPRIGVLDARPDALQESSTVVVRRERLEVLEGKVLDRTVAWVRLFDRSNLLEVSREICSRCSGCSGCRCIATTNRLGLLLLEKLEPGVQFRDDLCLRDAEPRRRRNIACAISSDRRVLTASATH